MEERTVSKESSKEAGKFKILIMPNLKELKLWSKNLINWKRDIKG